MGAIRTLGIALVALVPAAIPAAAQDVGPVLPLKSEVPAPGAAPCPALPDPEEPTPEERAQATDLGASAAQSLILGDLERVRDLLARATQLDPTSADLAYRYARVLEDVGEPGAAVEAYCRVVALEGDDPGAVADARVRIEALTASDQPALPADAVEAFRMGVLEASAGRLDDATRRFRIAAAAAPAWPAAHYNLGVVLDRRGENTPAIRALNEYLALRPDAPDALAVSRRVGQLLSTPAASPTSAATALGLGLIPGGGQLYTGRPGLGVGILGWTGGLVAASAWAEEGDDRTFVTPGLGVAGGVVLVGALDAFFAARRSQDRGRPPAVGPAGAFALGLLPGLGQLYRGRSGAGFTALALASGSAAGAFLYEEGEGRGYFGTGLGIASAVTGLTAIEAAMQAHRRQQGPGAGPPSPGGALALGLVPGLGHFYADRLGTGMGFLALTSALVAASDVAEDGDDRRYVYPGLGVAGGVTLIGALDAFIEARRVRDGTVGEPPSPAAALGLGLLPGLGQFYTGRPGAGLAVLTLASGSLATSFLYEEGEGRGLFSEGITAASVVTGIAAIEAFLHARGRRGGGGGGAGAGEPGGAARGAWGTLPETAGPGEPVLHGPALVGGGPGVRVRWVGLTF